jgi:hypothetical protein
MREDRSPLELNGIDPSPLPRRKTVGIPPSIDRSGQATYGGQTGSLTTGPEPIEEDPYVRKQGSRLQGTRQGGGNRH